MPFDIALSGIRAASTELSVTGNNIANASTTGFKSSRAEFGDVYATSVLGAGSNQVGAGVEIQDTAQQFSQGNITFTDSALDLAVNGNGFFILSDEGSLSYTRSGAFGLDADGFITANNGSRLQGYTATTDGDIEPVTDDIQLETSTIDPRQTTQINQDMNFDATSAVLPINGQEFEALGPLIGVAQAGTDNGYAAQSFDIEEPDGTILTYTTNSSDAASAIAAEINSISGLTASAENSASLGNLGLGAGTDLTVTLNSVPLNVTSLTDLETQINQLTNSSLPGITAAINTTTGELDISSTVGTDFVISVSGDAAASLDVTGAQGAGQTLSPGGTDEAVVGGTFTVVVEDGYSVSNLSPDATGLFESEATLVFTDVVINDFDPTDPDTYNSATSTTIYDSFGIAHVMTQYFVKQPYNASDATSSPNHWQMHVLVDGENVGIDDPLTSEPTVATYDIYFNSNGSLDETRSSEFLITNWAPESTSEGLPLQPDPAGTIPLPDPPISSNFVIDVSGTTQFGTSFTVSEVDQNGYTAGQLSGISVDDTGVIFARFTNGESLALGQVVLADFDNQQGLQPLGDTSWAQTFESGDPVINEPGTGSLGAIQAGALEDSNVDLSEQLVALIIAQRNFQASAKTIETADQTTQTIINLR